MNNYCEIFGLVREWGEKFANLLEACRAHGDLGFAAQQAGVPERAAKGLMLYEGEDLELTEASVALYASVKEGRPRQDGYAKKLFLTHLAMRGIIPEAVAAQPWRDLRWFSAQRAKDPDFDLAWQEALTAAAGRLHAEAWRRGYDGVNEPLTYLGQITHEIDEETGEKRPVTIKKYSDQLLTLLLKKHDPSFRDSLKIDQSTKLTVDGVDMGTMLAGLDDSELAILLKLTKSPATHSGELAADDETDTES